MNDEAKTKSDVSLKQLIKQFFSLQEERVKTYKIFDEGFRIYLNGNDLDYDFLKYRQHVHEVTQKFISLSQDIRTVEDALKDHGKLELASIIRSIQLKEKEKLDMTAKLQIKEKDCIEYPEEDYSSDVSSLKSSLQSAIENINDFLQDLKYEAEDILLQDTEEQSENNS